MEGTASTCAIEARLPAEIFHPRTGIGSSSGSSTYGYRGQAYSVAREGEIVLHVLDRNCLGEKERARDGGGGERKSMCVRERDSSTVP